MRQRSVAIEFGFDRTAHKKIERLANALRWMPRAAVYPAVATLVALVTSGGLILARAIAAGREPTLAWAGEDLMRSAVTYAYVALSGAAVFGGCGYLAGRRLDRARLLSITDPLTGLVNRRHFGDRLAAEMSRARRRVHNLSVLAIDLDRLKAINDSLGHEAGDRALLGVTRVLLECVRESDVAARIGGDEFAVLLPETDAVDASALAARILVSVAYDSDPFARHLTVSIGIAEMHGAGSLAPSDLLGVADAALSRAKAAGGGQAAIARAEATPLPVRRARVVAAARLVDRA